MNAAFTPTATLVPLNKLTHAAAATLAAMTTCITPSRLHATTTLVSEQRLPIEHVTAAATTTTTTTKTKGRSPVLRLKLPSLKREKSAEQIQAEQTRRRLLQEAWEVFRERYVDESAIDWGRLKRRVEVKKLRSDRDLNYALEWLFSHADDPFTRFLSASQLESMKDDIDGEMCGVGIVFYAEAQGWRRTKRVIIKHVVKNSPAAEAGLMTGDQITAIDMVGVRRMSFDEATQRLLGREGRKVLISFCRAVEGERIDLNVTLTRRRFEVPTVSAEILDEPTVGKVGYLQVREFAANTASQARQAVREISGGGAVLFVLDMRGNSGGLVDKAVEVAKVFLERDRIVVRFVGRNGAMTTERCGWRLWRPRVHVTKVPMVILVDNETASAAELVAAALRDNCRAVVIGNSTFGKGSVQAIVPLSDGTGVAVTVARYRTPKDKGIEMGRGLRPDLFKNNLAEDGASAVKELFGKSGARRMRWVVGRLGKCVAPECGGEGGRREGRAGGRTGIIRGIAWDRSDGS